VDDLTEEDSRNHDEDEHCKVKGKINSKKDPDKPDEIVAFFKKVSGRDLSNVRKGVVDEINEEKCF